MELYVDTGDLKRIKEIAEDYPIDGFTTNPSILSAVKEPREEIFRAYKEFIEEKDLKIFIQTTGETAEEIYEQGTKLHDYFGDRLVIKIPSTKEGFKGARLCKESGYHTCITVIHSVMQAIMAAKCGADYVAPYVNHFDNMGFYGPDVIEEMLDGFAYGNYDTKVLGASFRNIGQMKDLVVRGCEAITVAPDLFDSLIAHAGTDEAMVKFRKTWKDHFGEMQVSDLIPKE